MLIIAIPKSASTSLLITLGDLHNIKTIQDFSFRGNEIPKLSNKIHLVHSDIRELTDSEVEKFGRRDYIHKQHIFPSDNNLKLLQDFKKVILLRPPEDILMAYQRGAKRNFNSLPPGYETSLKKEDLISKAYQDGFYSDLKFFYETWLQKADSNTLIIHYKDFIKNPKIVINKIEYFYQLPFTNTKVIPAKARYSKLNHKDLAKKIFTKLKISLHHILTKVGLKDFIKGLIRPL